ncbi:MAG: GNAT family N-acetyltransferase [Firmicutes bacterium]|nr:GNAT family N-acetyltransferase [Bacillota bacterium]
MEFTFTVKKLTENDVPEMLKLCQGNPLYYKHMKICPTSENLKESMTALPSGKREADKYFVGFYDGNQLAAILDLILHFPNPQTAFIGWFIIAKEYQHQGTGSALVEEILSKLKHNNFSKVRLGYIKTNPQSRRFWEKNGFTPTGVESREEQYTVVIMEKIL